MTAAGGTRLFGARGDKMESKGRRLARRFRYCKG